MSSIFFMNELINNLKSHIFKNTSKGKEFEDISHQFLKSCNLTKQQAFDILYPQKIKYCKYCNDKRNGQYYQRNQMFYN